MHYVIGDVHGCYNELMRLLDRINTSDSDAIIFFTGDFIDRGPHVCETLQWMMEYVTPNGKYQSVLGNHEDMVLQWWRDVKNNWTDDSPEMLENLPKLRYGFDEALRKAGLFNREYVERVVEFFENFPLRLDLPILSKTGRVTNYVIAHAYLPYPEQSDDERNTYLWSRKHNWGYNDSEGRVLVHGHTPTTDFDYLLRNRRGRPGMIVYANNCVNVDSGCYYHYTWQGSDYPCFLSAICLETLEEIYSHTIEERFEEYLIRTGDELYQLDREMGINFKVEQYWENLKNYGYVEGEEFYYRDKILKK